MNNNTKRWRHEFSRRNPVIVIERGAHYKPQRIQFGESPRLSRRPKVGGTG